MKKALIILFILTFPSIWPLLKPGFYQSHDGEWMVIRFSAFHQTLTAGQFPVRFVDRLNNNYGYPVTNFLYPLPFYLAEIPKILGLGFVSSIKIIFAASTLLSALAMFWAVVQFKSKPAAFAAAIVYVYFPYRFVDLYVRGSIGEALAFLFMPIMIASTIKIKKGKTSYSVLLSLSSAALILSHNVAAALFVPLVLVSSLFLFPKISYIKNVLFPMVLALALSCFFWLPALFDLKYVRLSQIKVSEISDHLVNITKVVSYKWGYGPNPNAQDGMSTQIGVVSIAIFLALLIVAIKQRTFTKPYIALGTIYLFFLFLTTNLSRRIWINVPSLDIIQFPWRLLLLQAVVVALMAAYLVDSFKNKTALVLTIVLASIITTFPYTFPSAFTNHPDTYYSTNESTTNVREEYLPIWAKDREQNRADKKIEVDSNSVQIQDEIIKPTNYRAKIISSQDTSVQVNSIYFPGWKVKVNGQQIPIDYSNPQGLINFSLPKGESHVIIKYQNSGTHLVSEIISAAALILLIIPLINRWRKRNSKQP